MVDLRLTTWPPHDRLFSDGSFRRLEQFLSFLDCLVIAGHKKNGKTKCFACRGGKHTHWCGCGCIAFHDYHSTTKPAHPILDAFEEEGFFSALFRRVMTVVVILVIRNQDEGLVFRQKFLKLFLNWRVRFNFFPEVNIRGLGCVNEHTRSYGSGQQGGHLFQVTLTSIQNLMRWQLALFLSSQSVIRSCHLASTCSFRVGGGHGAVLSASFFVYENFRSSLAPVNDCLAGAKQQLSFTYSTIRIIRKKVCHSY